MIFLFLKTYFREVPNAQSKLQCVCMCSVVYGGLLFSIGFIQEFSHFGIKHLVA